MFGKYDDFWIDVHHEDEYYDKEIKVEQLSELKAWLAQIFQDKTVRSVEIFSHEEFPGIKSKPLLETTRYLSRKEWEKSQ
jgi:hypothetical protein